MAWNSAKGRCDLNQKDLICVIPNPKCGSSSMRGIFKTNGPFNYFKDKKKLNLDKYFLVSSIREPKERLVSGYLEMIKRGENKRVKETLGPETEEKFFNILTYMKNNEIFDTHLEKQTFYLTNNENELLPFNYLVLFENYAEGIKEINKILNKNFINKRGNTLPQNKKNTVKKYLENKEILNLFNEIYYEDIELYNKVIFNSKNILR